MSDNRKVLVAKRKNEKGKGSSWTEKKKDSQHITNFRQGTKRSVPFDNTPKKNLANDRLKRLRTTLIAEVKNSSNQGSNAASRKPSTCVVNNNSNRHGKSGNTVRKRAQTASEQVVAIKVPRPVGLASSEPGVSFKKDNSPQKHDDTELEFYELNKSQFAEHVEAMEWSTTDEEISFSSPGASTSVTYPSISSPNCTSDRPSFNQNFFIVVDTNILISQLQIIKDIITMTIGGDKQPVIFIPWMVIEELDFIKDDSNKTSLKFKAQQAIKYIEEILSTKHPRMMGQTLNAVNEQKDLGKSQDNKIIGSCLQVMEKYRSMILLTADINLKNKAHFNNIPVCSHTDVKTKILQKLNRSKSQIILEKMTSLCSNVIYECARKSYGQVCHKMPICQTSPKSLEECISMFTKYWFPVFQEVLMKQFKKSVDDLSTFLNKNKIISDGSAELNELTRLSVRVCLFLKDVDCCKNAIAATIRDLNNIKDS